MSSSQSGTIPQTNYYPLPKAVVLLNHGWNGSEDSLKGITDKVDNVNTFTIDYVANGDQSISDIGIPLKDKEVLLQNSNKSLEGKILFIRTKFKNKTDYVENQSLELKTIIEHLSFIYQGKAKIIFVGHSKGGLVGVHFATTYPNTISGLISLGTPYNYQLIPNSISFDSTLTDKTQMINIKNAWNTLPNKPKAYALGAKVIPHSIVITTLDYSTTYYSDTVVEYENQRAEGYLGITKYKLADVFEFEFIHTSMCNQWRTYNKVVEFINAI